MTTGTWTLLGLLWAVGALPPDVVPLNEPNFAIPVKIDEAQRARVRELQLFVSRDEGRTWSMEGKTTPSDNTSFPFIAQKNGLYWFLVVVEDVNGKKDPPSPDQGQVIQKILVDTLKPELRATADRQGAEVVVKWEVREEYPNLGTLKLEYRPTDGASAWQTVGITPAASGQATFQPGVSGDVQVRLEVADLAGNKASSEAKVPGLAGGTTTVARPSSPPPGPVGGALAPPPVPGPVAPPAPPPPAPTPAPTGPLPPAPGGDRAWNPVNSGSAPAPMPLEQPRAPAGSGWDAPRSPVSPVQHVPGGFTRERIADTSGTRPADDSPVTSGPPATRGGPAPPLPTLQVINTLKVPIEYEVTQFGPSGVKMVDLYLTQDNGQTWVLYGSTDSVDQAPPPDSAPAAPATLKRTLAVDLLKEGVYGFFLLPKSGAGLSKSPPQPGTLPQLRVEVDLTPPTAEMYRPEADPAKRDNLVLSWKAHDRNLTARPIKMEWAERKDGHWEVIGEGELTNTGRFNWQVPKGLPPRVFLRLTVRDSGGNVSVAETPEPILVDLVEPVLNNIKVAIPH